MRDGDCEGAARGRRALDAGIVFLAVLFAAPGTLRAQAQKQPVFVGARACAKCHEGKAAGNQYSHWLTTAHSKAWASLATPEAKQMARLSGIPDEPEKAPICLGCHATAADSEKWERDAGFHVEDGVQCEKCHGPGSEYMDEAVMRDPEAAHKAGLRKFTKRDCAVCHYVKGSHVAVHRKPQLDIDEAMKVLAHPVPQGAAAAPAAAPPAVSPPAPSPAGPKYVGAQTCGACHQGPMMGYQLSLWRMSPHAQAYAVLSTPRAAEIAKKRGIAEDPQVSPACLKCHATGGGAQAPAAKTFSPMEGVGCESCHGPGSEYMSEPVMRDKPGAMKAGLEPVTEKTCLGCHTSTHEKPFDFAAAKAKIAHPTRPESDRSALGKRSALSKSGGVETGGQYGMAASGGAQSFLEDFEVHYKNPVNLAFRPDGREVWVACEASGSVIVVDAAKRVKIAEIPVGGQATGLVFAPDGTHGLRDRPAQRQRGRHRRGHAQAHPDDPGRGRATRDRDRSAGPDPVRDGHGLRRGLGGRPRHAARRPSDSPRAAIPGPRPSRPTAARCS